MTEDEEELQSCWELLRRPRPVQETSSDPLDIRASLEDASLKAGFDVQQLVTSNPGLMQDVHKLVSLCARKILQHWEEHLLEGDPSTLIEIVLRSKQIPPDDLRDFVRTLPVSFLKRVVGRVDKEASGVHGLLSLELRRRADPSSEYSIERAPGGVVMVRAVIDSGVETLFRVDEKFPLE